MTTESNNPCSGCAVSDNCYSKCVNRKQKSKFDAKQKYIRMFKDKGIEWDFELERDWTSRVSKMTNANKMSWFNRIVFNHEFNTYASDTISCHDIFDRY